MENPNKNNIHLNPNFVNAKNNETIPAKVHFNPAFLLGSQQKSTSYSHNILQNKCAIHNNNCACFTFNCPRNAKLTTASSNSSFSHDNYQNTLGIPNYMDYNKTNNYLNASYRFQSYSKLETEKKFHKNHYSYLTNQHRNNCSNVGANKYKIDKREVQQKPCSDNFRYKVDNTKILTKNIEQNYSKNIAPVETCPKKSFLDINKGLKKPDNNDFFITKRKIVRNDVIKKENKTLTNSSISSYSNQFSLIKTSNSLKYPIKKCSRKFHKNPYVISNKVINKENKLNNYSTNIRANKFIKNSLNSSTLRYNSNTNVSKRQSNLSFRATKKYSVFSKTKLVRQKSNETKNSLLQRTAKGIISKYKINKSRNIMITNKFQGKKILQSSMSEK